MRGWLAFISRAKSVRQQIEAYAKLHALLEDFTTRPVLDFDQDCAIEFEALRRSRVRIGTMDMPVGAQAQTANARLANVDRKWRI